MGPLSDRQTNVEKLSPMQLACSHCKRTLDYSGERPMFCAFCGGALPKLDVLADTTTLPPRETEIEAEPEMPANVGDYRLLRELGRGGMGVVWEAEQAGTGRRVALKVLSPQLDPSEETLARFLREARSAAALSHQRSTFIFGAGEYAGQPYIVMELMPGRTLMDVIKEEGPLPVNRAVDYLLDVIEGLEAAHALGIIHRDVKPSNCFLDSGGRIKVGDFGLSKSLVSDAALTRTGAFMGTPLFAAPEQVRGGVVDQRTDIYAVGATLFYLIAGRGPFRGDPTAIIAQIASDPAPSLRNLCPAVPRDLDRIVARTLEKDPELRYAQLGQLRQALLPFASGGSSIADVGRRLSAFMIDRFAVGIVLGIGGAILGMVLGVIGGPDVMRVGGFVLVMRIELVVTWLGPIAYFAVVESWWGRGLGKLLLGLRVVGAGGEPAGWGRTLLRSLFIPGALGISLASLLLMPLEPSRMDLGYLLGMMSVTFLRFVPLVLFLVTMRARNGYRGVHELVSGTRVVRLQSAAVGSALPVAPVIAPVALPEGPRQFGPFRAVGTIGQSGPVMVLQAQDDLLQRPVWIHLGPSGAAPTPVERVRLARPTRLRWLQGGATDGQPWDAFEAVVGAPLLDALGRGGRLEWEQGRFVLLDLAEELAAAVADGTLPESLTLEQVWLDHGGRVKLLDRAVPPPGVPEAAPGATLAAAERALVLLRTATDLCTRGQVLPGHAQHFSRELAERPAEAETLTWAARQLRDLTRRSVTLRWDDRLGILAVTAGIEYSFYWLVGLLVSLLAWTFSDLPMEQRVLPALVIDVALPALLGFWLRGGPVFHFLGIEVRRLDGRPASRWRCAWRNVVAWLPLTFFNAVLPLYIAMQTMSPDAETLPHSVLVLAILFSCGGACVGVLALAGVIYSIIRPRRGIQDLLAGTCLVPR
jgi:hypothetical protein